LLRLSAGLVLGLAACTLPAALAQTPDPKYRTPRATLCTFYVAADLAREDPRHVADAVGCLDLGGLSNPEFGGMLADRLETVLAAFEVAVYRVPDDDTQEECVLPDTQGHRLALRRMPDGQYRFDRETLAAVSAIWAELRKAEQAKGPTADTRREVRLPFASPRATFRTFMKALRRDDLDTAVSCLDLRDVAPAARQEVGVQLARRLHQVINRNRLAILQQIPDTQQGQPYVWFAQPDGLIDLAREYRGERTGDWLFSAATVASIDRLYADSEGRPFVPEVGLLGTSRTAPTLWHERDLWFRDRMPTWARTPVVTTQTGQLKAYQLLGLALFVGTAFGLCRLWTAMAGGLAGGVLRRAGVSLPRDMLRRRVRALPCLAGVLVLREGVLVLALDRALLTPLLTALNPLGWLCGAWAAFRFIDLVSDAVRALLRGGDRHVVTSQMLLPVGSLLLKILISLATLGHLMRLFDWDVTALLTGLGIGGLAFALGAQDSLKNLFGSFTLIADRPFVVGERVKIGQHGEGVVEVVGLRSTRIRTGDDAVLTVPNSDLTTMHITNYGRRGPGVFRSTLGISYGTPPERLLAFCDALRELIQHAAGTDQDKCVVTISDLGPAAVAVQVAVAFGAADGGREPAAREALIVEILRLAEATGVAFAAPTPTAHAASPAAGPIFRRVAGLFNRAGAA
jgi:MscS family membrane protein